MDDIRCWKRPSSGCASPITSRLKSPSSARRPPGLRRAPRPRSSVALLGALDCLTPGQLTPHEVAHEAHAIEVEMLKQQSGIQDQLARPMAASTMIDMHAYPHAVRLADPCAQLGLVGAGAPAGADLSGQGAQFLADSRKGDPRAGGQRAGLREADALRVTAEMARDAVYAGDFPALGASMIVNTRGSGRAAPRSGQRRRAAGHRDCAPARSAGLEGERRGRRRRLDHPALRRSLRRETRHAARDRGGQSAVQQYPHLPQPLWAAHLGARWTNYLTHTTDIGKSSQCCRDHTCASVQVCIYCR